MLVICPVAVIHVHFIQSETIQGQGCRCAPRAWTSWPGTAKTVQLRRDWRLKFNKSQRFLLAYGNVLVVAGVEERLALLRFPQLLGLSRARDPHAGTFASAAKRVKVGLEIRKRRESITGEHGGANTRELQEQTQSKTGCKKKEKSLFTLLTSFNSLSQVSKPVQPSILPTRLFFSLTFKYHPKGTQEYSTESI